MKVNAPQLLSENVNYWFINTVETKTNAPYSRMLRTLDGNARAMLSPRFRILDNAPLAEVVLQEYASFGGELILESCEITEKRLYMKFVYPKLHGEVKPGDIIQAGVVVGNSEVGFG